MEFIVIQDAFKVLANIFFTLLQIHIGTAMTKKLFNENSKIFKNKGGRDTCQFNVFSINTHLYFLSAEYFEWQNRRIFSSKNHFK